MVFFATERGVCKRQKLEIRRSKAGRKRRLEAGGTKWRRKVAATKRQGPSSVPVGDQFSSARLGNMEVTLHIPDDIARCFPCRGPRLKSLGKRLSAAGGDLSRRALESIALEGYRNETLTLYQISQVLGLSRVGTFSGRTSCSSRGDRRSRSGSRGGIVRSGGA